MPELTPYVALRLVLAGSAIASMIGSAEWLYLHRHFRDSGIYSWRVQRLAAGRAAAPASLLLAYPQVLAIPVIQLALSALLLLPALSATAVGSCALGVALCYFLLSFRGVDGFTGGDAMAKVVMLAGGVALLAASGNAVVGALLLITGHLLIAYSTPGWSRLFDSKWHNGTKIIGVMRTETFGRRAVWRFLEDNRGFARFVASSIALWEAFFILYLFLPTPLLLLVLSIGVVFHFTNAFVMGLNIFPWSFIGAYPAVIWTAAFLQRQFFDNSILHV